MEVYFGLEEIPDLNKTVVTSGFFDGVHLAHQKIIAQINDIANEINGHSVVLTFWPHPRQFFSENATFQLITTLEEKLLLLESYHVDVVVVLKFDEILSNFSAAEYVQKVLIEALNTHTFVIGYDHVFGKGREGNFNWLKSQTELPFHVMEISKQTVDEITVSATKIRELILSSRFSEASLLLGHPFVISGIVGEGKKIGRTIGFPTANLIISSTVKLLPPLGVYIVEVQIDSKLYQGMLNIGKRPTFDGQDISVEVHILDFDADLYGKQIYLHLLQFVRAEMKFPEVGLLINQIKLDKITTINYFENDERVRN